jgi:hypothetical protein
MFERMRSGWQLTKKAWSVVRANKGLAKLPLTGGLLALAAWLVIAVPGLVMLGSDIDSIVAVGVVLLALGSYLAAFVIIYYNVILAAAADEALQGREPDMAAARSVARNRIPVIAGWALVSGIVSLFFAVLRDRGGVAGRIAAGIGAAIWGLVTFLVVPVLALEGIGPIAAVKRSGQLVKERFGQQVTGNLVIGGIAGLVMIAGGLVGALGVVMVSSGSTAGIAGGALLAIAGLVIVVGGAVYSGATRGVFGVALYHYVADDKVVGPFTTADLASAARQR